MAEVRRIYSLHSFRVTATNLLMAAGAPPHLRKNSRKMVVGQWHGDIHQRRNGRDGALHETTKQTTDNVLPTTRDGPGGDDGRETPRHFEGSQTRCDRNGRDRNCHRNYRRLVHRPNGEENWTEDTTRNRYPRP